MSANRATRLRGLRLIAVLVILTLFSAGILHSARSIRYAVDGKPTTEYQVTKLSLTHEVERDAKGQLTNPYANADSSLPSQGFTLAKASDVQFVRVASSGSGPALEELAAKKAAPKKIAPKKPAPQKPTKKTTKKKPKACPT